jgi:hypothetical protein
MTDNACNLTPNELAAQKAQLQSVPQSTASHGNSPENWQPLGSKPDGGGKTQ